jgi:hypothetical protein
MAFLEDPRLRQRWNQISHTTEAVTENAAAGIWSFGHSYVNPCLESIGAAAECCLVPCLGDREERARRKRDRERERGTAEYSFDFYDDWDEDLGGEDHGGFMGRWRNEDWDRLLAGTGRDKRGANTEIHEQPRTRKRGMSYGTRGNRRKSTDAEDPTIIPSTQAIGFLGKLPFKIGGTLRYKPSAANLREHPGSGKHHHNENDPLLGHDSDDLFHSEQWSPQRKRSNTTGSGDTSDSYRSRGDLFPSDGEGDEDAVPLDDEFAVALDRVDDRASNKTRSSKGKRIAGYSIVRSGSRATVHSDYSRPNSLYQIRSSSPVFDADESAIASLEDLRQEEEEARREEDEEIRRKRQAAVQLALERGLQQEHVEVGSVPKSKAEMVQVEDIASPKQAEFADVRMPLDAADEPQIAVPNMAEAQASATQADSSSSAPAEDFVPARLPYFR